MNQRIFIANILLLVVILGLGYLVLTTRYEPPERLSPVRAVMAKETPEDPEEEPEGSETTYKARPTAKPPERLVAQLEDKYPNFGPAPIFDTIIPKPTPRPTPTKAPQKPPEIARVTARWKLSSLFANTATFYDSGTKKDWTMQMGEVKEVKYRNKTCKIKLEKVDENSFEVTIGFGEQRRKFSMW